MDIIIAKDKQSQTNRAFGTHSDAVQVVRGTEKKTLTEVLNSTIDSHAVQTDTFIEKVVGNPTTMATENPKKRASVTNVKGNTVNVVQTGNLTNITGNNISISQASVSGFTGSAPSGSYDKVFKNNSTFNDAHVYYYCFYYKSNLAFNIQDFNSSLSLNSSSEFIKISRLGARQNTYYSAFYFYLYETTTETWDIEVRDFQVFDLTLLGIDNLTTAAEVEEWLEKNIGKQDYYPYCEGKLLNYAATGISTVGFNLWDEEWRVGTIVSDGTIADNAVGIVGKNYCPIVGGKEYFLHYSETSSIIIYFYDTNYNMVPYTGSGANENGFDGGSDSVFTAPINASYFRIRSGRNGVLYYKKDVCINLSDPSRNGTYEPYKKNTYDFDVKKIYGKLNGTGEYVQIFPDGMKGAGSVHDELDLLKAEALVKVGDVDLGSLSWAKDSINGGQTHAGYAALSSCKVLEITAIGNILCSKYKTDAVNNVDYAINGNAIGGADQNHRIWVFDSAHNNDDATEFKNMLDGVIAYYELATYLSYTSCIYRDNGIDTPLAELNIEEDNYGTIKIEGTMVAGNPSSCAPTVTMVDNLHKGDAQQWAKNTSISTVIGSTLGNIESLLAAI